MLPTLNGRLQSRILVTAILGGIWTLIITPVLPTGAPLGESYKTTFIILLTVIVLGVLWEFLYHFLQQFRWEKDWPTSWGLFTGINEGLLIWLLINLGWIPGVGQVPGWAFVIQFCTTWFLIWAVQNGPLRVPFIRWRFNGGRFL
ncbi:hypothetical protein [Occultella gossypii]|uniref:Uncharacterized protein n=1 Tax=Occultella gossypii TaxID=2800820 RepID=A0ABS7S2Z9_9MICO|nr:hypothetical protein [Occultella gossypii]MBZ2194719.1 hypothetical protein [Occultella gossypii]